jgi:hypothetical protein
MPEKVKIKLGGHGESKVAGEKRVIDFITRAVSLDNQGSAKMRIIRILRA